MNPGWLVAELVCNDYVNQRWKGTYRAERWGRQTMPVCTWSQLPGTSKDPTGLPVTVLNLLPGSCPEWVSNPQL